MPAHLKRSKQMLLTKSQFKETTGVMGSCERRRTGEREWTALHGLTMAQNLAEHFLRNTQEDSIETGSIMQRRRALGSAEHMSGASDMECCLRDNSSSEKTPDTISLQYVAEQTYDKASSWTPLMINTPSERNSTGQGLTEEIMAAAVLTSLSLSPVLTEFPAFHSNEDDPDPEDDIFYSDAAMSATDLSDEENDTEMRSHLENVPVKNSFKTVFQCTWPRCCKILSTSAAIFWHVRSSHLGPKGKNDDGFSDGEEEFYFNEIDARELLQNPSSLSCSRPQARRYRSMSDPSRPTQSTMLSSPAHMDDTFTRPLRSAGGNRLKTTKQHTSITRKARGDGRKCRKVYGMENRHLWCTQCRWKKACIKFVD